MPGELVRKEDREFAAAFGANLARLRRARGMSQEALMFQSEVHRTGIGSFERGEHIPRCDTALKLCAGLGVSPNELFKGLSWTPPSLTKGQPLFGTAAGSGPTTIER
jgi:transcriptional regulator with XRE-family HTH domain